MKKLAYIEYLRVIAAFSVVIIHVAIGLPNNYSIVQIGVVPYAIMNSTYLLVNWAVPVFFMITGSLLLNEYRNINEKKIRVYVSRMLKILIIFGISFSVVELLFRDGFSIGILLRAIIYTAEGKSWDHLWYIYMLISFYLITIPLRHMIAGLKRENMYGKFLVVLVIGNFLIQTINVICGLELQNFMQFGQYLTYYLLGDYLATTDIIGKYRWGCVFGGVTLFKFVAELFWIINEKEVLKFVHDGRFLCLIQAISLFLLFKNFFKSNDKISKVLVRISRASFGIYLVHPVFGNLFYKVLMITPLSMPTVIGIVFLSMLFFVLSWVTVEVLLKVPIINKII